MRDEDIVPPILVIHFSWPLPPLIYYRARMCLYVSVIGSSDNQRPDKWSATVLPSHYTNCDYPRGIRRRAVNLCSQGCGKILAVTDTKTIAKREQLWHNGCNSSRSSRHRELQTLPHLIKKSLVCCEDLVDISGLVMHLNLNMKRTC
jgi:hypothetical protein